MSNRYWEKRKRARMDEYHRDSDRVIGKVLETYQDAIADINSDMDKIFNTYAKNGSFSKDKSIKYLNQKIPNFLLNTMKKAYPRINNEKMRRWMLSKINAPAYRARITRLEAIKESLYLRCKQIADVEIRMNTYGYTNIINSAYYKTIFDIQKMTGIGFSFAEIPTRQIEEILKNNWSGKHYSERIWQNTDVLASELEYTLTKGFMSGASVQRMSKEIADKMQVGEYAATRLIRTETTYVANMAELEAYKEVGVEKIMYLATLDLRTSDICRKHDKKIILVKDAAPGVNIPPLHAHCRSTTIEIFEDDDLSKLQRRARDPETGKNKTVPANTNYKDWYKENVANNPRAMTDEKKIKKKANDKKQYENFKEVLGNDLPKSFDKFQELKYNNVKEWPTMKDYYKTRSEGNISAFSSFSDYKSVKKELTDKLIGIKTTDGIEIKSFSKHMIDRILGASNDPKTGLPRSGTTVEGVLDALLNPLKIAKEKSRKLDKVEEISKKYIGKTTTVSVNPDTGNLIQSNPTSEKLVKGLRK